MRAPFTFQRQPAEAAGVLRGRSPSGQTAFLGRDFSPADPSGLIPAVRDEIAEHLTGALHDFLTARVESARRKISGRMLEK